MSTYRGSLVRLRRALALQRHRHLHVERRLQRAEAERDEQRRRVAMTAHDLRSPLHTIGIALSLLDADALPGSERPLRLARAAVARAGTLLNDLLEIACIGESVCAPSPALQLQRTLLLDLVTRATEDARLRFPGRSVVLLAEQDGPAWVQVDTDRMAQVLDNLISNALLHSPTASSVSVQVCCQPAEAWVCIENAGGIPASVRARLFQPLNRGQTSANAGGLGLGLYIAQRLVTAHRGRIDVTGDDEATRFRVTLPRS